MISRILSRWPLYVWLLAVVTVFVLYARTSQFGGMPGVVETFEEPVAPLETARLQKLFVLRGQRVKAGDPIAQMDTDQLDARIAVDEAQILEAQGTISGYQQDIMQIVREFNDNIREAEAELEKERMQMLSEKAELDALRAEQERREELRRKNLISEQDASELRPRIAGLARALESYPELIALREKRLEEIAAQRDELFEWMELEQDGKITEAIREEMRAREKILKTSITRRHLQREAYTLRASRDGVVSRIFHEPGSVVNSGDPVALVVSEKSQWVVGFLPDIYISELREGQEVLVERERGLRDQSIAGRIEAISPEVRSLPGRVSPIRNQPLRGRRVMVKIERDDVFVPGESVRIRIPFNLMRQ